MTDGEVGQRDRRGPAQALQAEDGVFEAGPGGVKRTYQHTTTQQCLGLTMG